MTVILYIVLVLCRFLCFWTTSTLNGMYINPLSLALLFNSRWERPSSIVRPKQQKIPVYLSRLTDPKSSPASYYPRMACTDTAGFRALCRYRTCAEFEPPPCRKSESANLWYYADHGALMQLTGSCPFVVWRTTLLKISVELAQQLLVV